MHAHRFDPLSAVLGLLAVAGGALAASGSVDPFVDSDVGIWATVLALVIGLMMIPWGWRRSRLDVGSTDVGLTHGADADPGGEFDDVR